MGLKVVTIGVYGFDEFTFFDALLRARVDTLCDVRMWRGVRGAHYAFANSRYLQQRLDELGITYIYQKALAPSLATRLQQRREDTRLHIRKRDRLQLVPAFVDSYRQECLSNFEPRQFVRDLGPGVKTVALLCVEREPLACHRSLIAQRLSEDLNADVEHLRP